MKNSGSFLFALFLFIATVTAQTGDQKEVLVSAGDQFPDSLSTGGSHSYSLRLSEDQFVFGQVLQETVDVVINLYDPEGEKVTSFDGPARGPENFSFETQIPGMHRIEVIPFKEEKGTYIFSLRKVEPLATAPTGRVDQLMSAYTGKDVPGAAVLVMENGEIIFSEGYGMASLTYKVPFETDTRTNIGSTSKQFTAFAIALLEDRGKLSLDADIRKYFPELPDFGQTVTIRHLLTHTSGYREFINTLAMAGHDISSLLDRERIIEIVQRQPQLQNDPGAEWNYNNTGYAILSLLIERVTETPFPEWMQENIFRPLGMNHTMVRKNQNQVVPGRTQGYNFGEDGRYAEATDLGGAMGAGTIYTTLGDLALWIRNFKEPKVGNEQIIEKMTTPFVLTTGDTTNYGLGLFIEEMKGLRYYHHGGADIAHRSMLMIFPEIDAAVVTQSNNAAFSGAIPQKIATIFFEEQMDSKGSSDKEVTTTNTTEPYAYEPERFDDLAGRYELENAPGFILSFYRDGDRIYTQATGQPEIDLKATSDSTFTLQGVNANLTFHMKENGTADSLTLHQNGTHLARRITWKPDTSELQEYSGRYFSEELETLYKIRFEDDKLMLQHYSLKDIELIPGDKDSFAAGFPIAEISFTRDESGAITGFTAANGRTRGVFFEKQETQPSRISE